MLFTSSHQQLGSPLCSVPPPKHCILNNAEPTLLWNRRKFIDCIFKLYVSPLALQKEKGFPDGDYDLLMYHPHNPPGDIDEPKPARHRGLSRDVRCSPDPVGF